MFSQTGSCEWDCIIGNQKKWKGEVLEKSTEAIEGTVRLTAAYAGNRGQNRILLKWFPQTLPFSRILELFGKTPIPPYLKRDATEEDKTRYQTVYADFDGSVAAPTAGLHFTPGLIAQMKARNLHFQSLTLHVGSGTFIPVKSETIGEHRMHAETVIISKSTIQYLKGVGPDQLTVVGTTSLRSLESLYWLGQKIHMEPDSDPENLFIEQWIPYDQESKLSVQDSLDTILGFLDSRGLEEIKFITRLLIAPGYRFKLVNRLITNFHQPSSTLLLLVSALTGEKWREIYRYAMDHDFRFLSYGDSSLLEMQPENHG
jgi:S-adenosylmethionine:tRNA ribosyltransferase-isomerase